MDRKVLSDNEFSCAVDHFNILGISIREARGKSFEQLSTLIVSKHRKLSLQYHPDKHENKKDDATKAGFTSKFYALDYSYKELKRYIAPLKKGHPCDHEYITKQEEGHLTLRQFKYWEKTFREFNLTAEQVVGKKYDELYSILQKNNKFKTDIQCWEEHSDNLVEEFDELVKQYEEVKQHKNLVKQYILVCKTIINLLKLDRGKSTIQTYVYINGLKGKGYLICEDKRRLSLVLLWVKYESYFSKILYYILAILLTNLVVFFYGSWLLVGINILSHILLMGFVWMGPIRNIIESMENYDSVKECKASIDKLGKVWNLYYFLSIIIAASLLMHHFIVYGLTTSNIVFGSLFLIIIASSIYSHLYTIGCCMYVGRKSDDLCLDTSILNSTKLPIFTKLPNKR